VSQDKTPKGVPIGRMRVKGVGAGDAPIAAPPPSSDPPALPPPPLVARVSMPPEDKETIIVELGKISQTLQVLEPVSRVSRALGTVRGKVMTAGFALAALGVLASSVGMVWRAATRVEVQASALEHQQVKAEKLAHDTQQTAQALNGLTVKIGEFGASFNEFRQAQEKREEDVRERVRELERAAMRASTAATRAERAAGEAAAAARPLRRPR
jgi:hypothetical protein